ncbi:hypothetical protein [Candidatus Poriferisocius sp.]|uniref:hypothetical protein n=1 Tax=Candidatus Poriferisocius sp. TaxID=3101276 RepID=UPI003B019A49
MVPQPSQVRLVAYPSGIPADDVWSITHDSPPELADGEIEVDVQLISRSGRMTGFTMLDYLHRIPEAVPDLAAWVADGSLKHRQHIVEGIESFPEAFRMLFRGENHGKLLLRPF